MAVRSSVQALTRDSGVAFSSVASPVDLGKIYSVDQAQSMDEVKDLLGEPSCVCSPNSAGEASWYYSHPLVWHEFRVDFAKTGEVSRCVFGD